MLQRDGRMTNAELAHAISVSPATCHRRTQRLFDEGYIHAVRAEVAPRKVGRGTLVIVGVVLDRSTPESFAEFEAAIARLPAVLDCHLVAGDFDFFLKNSGSRHRRFQSASRRAADCTARRAPDAHFLRHERGCRQPATRFLTTSEMTGSRVCFRRGVSMPNSLMENEDGSPALCSAATEPLVNGQGCPTTCRQFELAIPAIARSSSMNSPLTWTAGK